MKKKTKETMENKEEPPKKEPELEPVDDDEDNHQIRCCNPECNSFSVQLLYAHVNELGILLNLRCSLCGMMQNLNVVLKD